MALEYFLYTELYNNTLIDRSMTSFAPLPADTGQILIDFLIPETQPLYLYKEDAGLIVANDDATIEAYVAGTAPPPQPDDDVIQSQFTGYTATTNILIGTKLNTSDFNSYSGSTLTNINTRVYRSGDTMTGTLCSTSNLFASGAVTGSSVSASVLMTTPILNASTSVCAPRITGSTCITSPITCGTTLVQSPVLCGSTCAIAPITIGSTCVCSPRIVGSISAVAPIVSGSTCVTSPITCATTRVQSPLICGSSSVLSPLVSGVTVCAGTCLCSVGTTRLVGAITAASTLNVSGNTTLGAQTYLNTPSTGGTLSDYNVVWDPITKVVRTLPVSGGTASVYCYADNRVTGNNATDVNATYLTRTWNLPSGYYEYEFSAIFGNDTANRCAIICFLFDGAVVGSCNLMKTNDTNVRSSAYITQNNAITTGIHSASMVYRQCGGGTASIYTGTIRVQKIAD